MKWQTVKRVVPAGPGRLAISFEECDHVRLRSVGDMVQNVVTNPEQMQGQAYPCNECAPGVEE
jgi:hypothetical protein